MGSNDTSFQCDGTTSTFRVMFKEPVEILPNTSFVACATLKVCLRIKQDLPVGWSSRAVLYPTWKEGGLTWDAKLSTQNSVLEATQKCFRLLRRDRALPRAGRVWSIACQGKPDNLPSFHVGRGTTFELQLTGNTEKWKMAYSYAINDQEMTHSFVHLHGKSLHADLSYYWFLIIVIV